LARAVALFICTSSKDLLVDSRCANIIIIEQHSTVCRFYKQFGPKLKEPFGQTDVQERDGWRPFDVIQTELDGEVSWWK